MCAHFDGWRGHFEEGRRAVSTDTDEKPGGRGPLEVSGGTGAGRWGGGKEMRTVAVLGPSSPVGSEATDRIPFLGSTIRDRNQPPFPVGRPTNAPWGGWKMGADIVVKASRNLQGALEEGK